MCALLQGEGKHLTKKLLTRPSKLKRQSNLDPEGASSSRLSHVVTSCLYMFVSLQDSEEESVWSKRKRRNDGR